MKETLHGDGGETWGVCATLFEQVAMGIAMMNLDGQIQRANPAFCRMLGYKANGVAGHLFAELIHPADVEDVQARHAELIGGAADVNHQETRFLAQDGSVVLVRLAASLFRDPAGMPQQVIWLAKNITARKTYERHVARMSREHEVILNATDWRILGIDSSGNINFANKSAARMLGRTACELLNRPAREVHHSSSDGVAYGEGQCSIYRALRDGLTRHADFDVMWCGDTPFPVEYTITPMLDEGRIDGVVIAFVDITERLAMQSELKARIVELTELNRRLDDTRNMLWQSEALAAAGQVVAEAASQISLPLQQIQSNVRVMSDCVLTFLEPTASMDAPVDGDHVAVPREPHERGIREMCQDVGRLLSGSTEELCQVSRIVGEVKMLTDAKFREEWVRRDVGRAIDGSLNILAPELRCRVSKDYGALPEIECRPSRLNQAFIDLLLLATRAAGDEGVIRIASGCSGDEVWVEVAGEAGEPDARSENASVDHGWADEPFVTYAVGGMSLARQIVDEHGGRIGVQAQSGRNMAYRVWLPLDRHKECA